MSHTISKAAANKINARVLEELEKDPDAYLDYRTFYMCENGERVYYCVLHPCD